MVLGDGAQVGIGAVAQRHDLPDAQVEIVPQRQQQRVVGEPDQRAMERVVGDHQRRKILGLGGVQHLLRVGAQLRHVGLALDHTAHREGLELLAEAIDLLHFLHGQRLHPLALVGLGLDQPVGLEDLDGLAHRRPRDVELLGQRHFDDRGAGPHGAVEDRLANDVGHHHAQRHVVDLGDVDGGVLGAHADSVVNASSATREILSACASERATNGGRTRA